MVKRAVAMVLGALAGVLLWHAVAWVRASAEPDAISTENCVRDAYVDCVGQGEALPNLQDELPSEPVAQPCKDFLSEGAGVAALSQCLHEVRRENGIERVKALERARQIATSS
jgi:hypothetical protein